MNSKAGGGTSHRQPFSLLGPATLGLLGLVAAAALSGCGGSGGNATGTTLTVIAPASFALGEQLTRQFEHENNVQVNVVSSPNAERMVDSAAGAGSTLKGDVMVGVDDLDLVRAVDAGLFVPYTSPLIDRVPRDLRTGAANLLTPIDYGYVNLNYDIDGLARQRLTPPRTLEELTQPQWMGKVAVENPATSSTGLAFLAATVSYFGPDHYLDWWREMRANGLVVVNSWTAAYDDNFTLHGGQKPVVVGYAASAAFEQMFAKTASTTSPVGNVLIPRAVFRDIEYAGILRSTQQETLARKFIDFLLRDSVQEQFPVQFASYPANSDAKLPEAFQKFASVNVATAAISPAEIAKNEATWIADWKRAIAN